MKKIVLALSVALLFVLALTVMTSCGGNDTTTTEITEAEIPEGYVAFENGGIRFAYPEDFTKQEGSTTLLSDAISGNNVTVVYENKNDTYKKMTVKSYEEDMIPQFEAAGMAIANPTVTQIKDHKSGLHVTKITHDITAGGVTMDQTMLIVSVGAKTYTVTVTEVTPDSKLVNTVYNTLSIDK